MGARVLWGIIVVLVVAIGAWYMAAYHMPEASPATSTTTTASSTDSNASTSAQSSGVPLTQPSADPAQIGSNMVGTWQSVDDGNYHVKITADGTWTDSYGTTTSATQTGKYSLFTNATDDKDLPIPAQPGVVYLKVIEGKDTFYYSVIEASSNTLQLSYLDRGNTLAFVRIQ
ncbi:MAG TPA: hypothetical protein VMU25_00695 [Candidatus Paceibacterota bacterium]|nr:hypothetical protein [Candidatus Paceibacterota bacterium]